jgi:hypothetical protein
MVELEVVEPALMELETHLTPAGTAVLEVMAAAAAAAAADLQVQLVVLVGEAVMV